MEKKASLIRGRSSVLHTYGLKRLEEVKYIMRHEVI